MYLNRRTTITVLGVLVIALCAACVVACKTKNEKDDRKIRAEVEMKSLASYFLALLATRPHNWIEIEAFRKAVLQPVPVGSIVPLPGDFPAYSWKEEVKKQDPWGGEYFLKLSGDSKLLPTVEIISFGPNGVSDEGRNDDIVVRTNEK